MIKRTRGNKTGVIIPLFTRTLHEDGTTSVEPFTPSSDDAVVVTLEAARKYNYTPIIGDNCVIFDLSGAEVAGVYSLTVSIARADGSRLRYFTREALELTELSSESGDDETAEFTVTGVELDAAWFFFAKGDPGDTGNGIASVEKTASSGLVDTYTITYTDGTTSTFSVTNGAAGADGRGISNIKKISSVENIDTYRINYTDGSFSLFNVTNGENGAPGRGIVNIKKDSSEGLVDTYEITYTDGTSDFFEVTNGAKGDPGQPGQPGAPGQPGQPGATGNGIAKIEKTATVGLVDTYTIYYTNGTTSKFCVTNGQSGAGGLQRVELMIDDSIHYKGSTTPLTFDEVRALVEDTTKFVTLYDGFNLFLPAYDDEGGAVIFSSAYIQGGSPQIQRVAINSENQIRYETAIMEYANLKTDNLNNEGSEQWRTYPTTHAVNQALATKQPNLTAGDNITIENNVISAVGGGGGGGDWELLVDNTTTSEISAWGFTQGDNGQVFNDYKKILLFVIKQPATNLDSMRITWSSTNPWTNNNRVQFGPNASTATQYCYVILEKTAVGIVNIVGMSPYNNTNSNYQLQNAFNGANNFALNTGGGLQDETIPLLKDFTAFGVGGYRAQIGIGSRLLILGKK